MIDNNSHHGFGRNISLGRVGAVIGSYIGSLLIAAEFTVKANFLVFSVLLVLAILTMLKSQCVVCNAQ